VSKSFQENIDVLLKIAEESAVAGGRHIHQEYFKNSTLSIKEKEKNDFVTNLDVESERIVRKIIKSYNPRARIIGEEEGEEGTDDSIEWYVDPLDGTGAFIRGNLAFVSVSVSAIEVKSRKVLVGAVYNPFTTLLYSASVTGKLNLAKSSGINQTITLNKARILLDISEDHPLEMRQILTPDNTYFGRILRYDGSFAQHMCLLATGTLDGGIFWGNGDKGTFWDLAAALLICQTSGLEVTDLTGEPISKSNKTYDQLVVAPKKLHKELLDWVKTVSAEHNFKLGSKDQKYTSKTKTKKTKKKSRKKSSKK
jgi:myo-inositol-1(or 4)-monophosphatase